MTLTLRPQPPAATVTAPAPLPRPAAAVAPAVSVLSVSLPFPVILAGLGGLLMIVGSFLPWAKVTAPFVGTLTKTGVDGASDGWLFVALGCVAFMVAAGLRHPGRAWIGAIVLGSLGALGGMVEVVWVSDRFKEMHAGADNTIAVVTSHGPGLFVIMAGGGLLLLAAYRSANE